MYMVQWLIACQHYLHDFLKMQLAYYYYFCWFTREAFCRKKLCVDWLTFWLCLCTNIIITSLHDISFLFFVKTMLLECYYHDSFVIIIRVRSELALCDASLLPVITRFFTTHYVTSSYCSPRCTLEKIIIFTNNCIITIGGLACGWDRCGSFMRWLILERERVKNMKLSEVRGFFLPK